jgi:hypothetical protein
MDNKTRRILAAGFGVAAALTAFLAFRANSRANFNADVDALMGLSGDPDLTGVWVLAAVTAVLVILAVMSLLSSGVTSQGTNAAGLVKCPHCAELVQPDARVCKHCGRDIDRTPPPTSA